MLGAAALTSLAAMRSGAGLVTVGVPQSLNTALHKKIASIIMTWPLQETKQRTLSFSSYSNIKKAFHKHNTLALGPGLSQNPSTRKLILKLIATAPVPMVIDADALNALSRDHSPLTRNHTPKVLTPHPGEMSLLTGLKKEFIEQNRSAVAKNFAKKFNCVLLLKGHRTVVASPGKIYINHTGNPGLATAGSGDVLTGMIAAFLAQGLSAFEAAKWGAYLHGKAGDRAAKKYSRPSLIASDVIEFIPEAMKKN